MNVLFLCTGSSARSQMAEALLRRHAGGVLNAHSAGTDPKGVNPLTVQALHEIGIDTDDLWSKGVEEFLGRLPVRYLIVVCGDADQKCPTVWPGVHKRMFWPFDDPAAVSGNQNDRLAVFRDVRDQIENRIKGWLDELQQTGEISLPAAQS